MRPNRTTLCSLFAILCCAFHTNRALEETASNLNKNALDMELSVRRSLQEYIPFNIYDWYNNIMKYSGTSTLSSKYSHGKFEKIIPALPSFTDRHSVELFEYLSVLMRSKLHPKDKFKFGYEKTADLSMSYGKPYIFRNPADNYNINFKSLKIIPGKQKINTPALVTAGKEHVSIANGNMMLKEHTLDSSSNSGHLMNNSQYVLMNIDTSERKKRSTAKLIHKLVRVPPLNLTDGPVEKENAPIDVELNTSSFTSPYHNSKSVSEILSNITLPYEQAEDLAFSELNGTEIQLIENDNDEHLPNPEELVSGHRYRNPNKHRAIFGKGDLKRKRMPIRSHKEPILQKKCERFTASMCIKAEDYPMEQIMGSIRRHKNAMSALLAEYHDKAAELEYQEQLEEYQFNSKRREDGNVITPGGMCASIVRYARPQKARSASGEWKYIVNTGHHTQTLRLEKCSTPQESCSYLSHNYRSRCTQVYNYHRLLSWDKTRGLHVDIFKVPTCCSCQVDGYKETFPPMGGTKHKSYKGYTPLPTNNPYVNDEIDYEDDDDENSPVAYQFHNGLKEHKYDNYQHSELLLGSTKIKTKVNAPKLIPTVGSYLSPPSDNYNSQTVAKAISYSNNVVGGRSRKPYKSFIPSESRVDLEISGTEQSNKEIKTIPMNDGHRIHQKRTRIYSDSDANGPYQTSGPKISSDLPPNHPLTEPPTTNSHTVPSPNTGKEIGSSKRINYSYHPIIDFFENHQKSTKGQVLGRNTAGNSIPISMEVVTSRDRRIGYGIDGTDNSWHPVMINS